MLDDAIELIGRELERLGIGRGPQHTECGVMRGFLLVFTLHFGQEHPSGDNGSSPDKVEAFLHRPRSFRARRSADFALLGVGKSRSLAGASVDQLGRQHRKGGARRADRAEREREGSRRGMPLV